jgi:hypothetical protein
LKSEDLFGRVDLDGEGRVAEFERVTEDDDEEREDSVAELMKHDEGGGWMMLRRSAWLNSELA